MDCTCHALHANSFGLSEPVTFASVSWWFYISDAARNETDGEGVLKTEKPETGEESKESEETQKDSEEPIVEGEENESETVEEVEPTSSQPEESTTGIPEDSSSQSDGKKKAMHFWRIVFSVLYCKI